MKPIFGAALLAIVLCCVAPSAKANSGDVDTTFGTNGVTAFPFDATGLVIQPDNKIVVAGHQGAFDDDHVALARFNADGSIDTTFGVNGMTLVPLSYMVVNAVTLQTNGKILVAGSVRNPANNILYFMYLQYNSNGFLDTTVGNNGLILAQFPPGSAGAVDIVTNARDQIILDGSNSYPDGSRPWSVAVFEPDGKPDVSFSGNGKNIVAMGGGLDGASSVEVLTNNQIVLGGVGVENGQSDFALARFRTDGVLDSTFGNGGKVFTNFGSPTYLTQMARLANNKIVAVGRGPNGQQSTNCAVQNAFDVALARYSVDGSLDTAFGSGGKRVVHFLTPGFCGYIANDLVIQSDGKIVVAGYAVKTNNIDLGYVGLLRLSNLGVLDTSFGNNGLALVPDGSAAGLPGQTLGRRVGLQSSGRIVVMSYSSMTRFLP